MRANTFMRDPSAIMNGLNPIIKKTAIWSVLVLYLLAFFGIPPAYAQSIARLKIGVVDLNRALNNSKAGKRSKNILLASKNQKQNELKAKTRDLKEKRDQLQNNMMLKPAVREKRKKNLQKQTLALRREMRIAQRELQIRERKLTESIYIELKTVIAEIAKKEKFNLILEKNASQVILYSSKKFEDITNKVIKRYDRFQLGK